MRNEVPWGWVAAGLFGLALPLYAPPDPTPVLEASVFRYSSARPAGAGTPSCQFALVAWPTSPAGPPIGARGVVLQPGFLPGFPCFDSDYDGQQDDADADDDGDGIPDSGDARPFDADNDGLNNVPDPDADNDGQTDGQELVAGTGPVNPLDWFRFETAFLDDPVTLELRWNARTGRRYDLLGRSEPGAGPWVPLDHRMATGDVLLRLRIPLEQPRQVFKLEVSQP